MTNNVCEPVTAVRISLPWSSKSYTRSNSYGAHSHERDGDSYIRRVVPECFVNDLFYLMLPDERQTRGRNTIKTLIQDIRTGKCRDTGRGAQGSLIHFLEVTFRRINLVLLKLFRQNRARWLPKSGSCGIKYCESVRLPLLCHHPPSLTSFLTLFIYFYTPASQQEKEVMVHLKVT